VRGKLRFVLPVFAFALLKIVGALWLLRRIGGGRDLVSVFHGWDSLYYMNIASSWYPNKISELWAFFPLYPYLSSLANLILRDVWLSTAFVSFIFGVFWLPLYQSISERYVDVDEALVSTLMFASFPQAFLFTTVAYSESLFLFTTLATWLLYLRGKTFGACVVACFATLTRPYGIAIVLPIFLDLLRRRGWMKLPLVSLPVASLSGWLWYSFMKTGDYLARQSAAQKFWVGQPWQLDNWMQELFPLLGLEPASRMIGTPIVGYVFLVPFTALAGYLIFRSFDLDWLLGIYGITMLAAILSIAAPLSSARLISLIFPLWLNIKTKNPLIALAVCAFFYLHGLVIWLLFTSNVWVG
jgi:hypothetical protein